MGKTTVLLMFGRLGAYTFNSDETVHDILKRPGIIKDISGILGEDVITKQPGGLSLDRRRMADIIFSDPRKREQVEKIIHPEVLKSMKTTESRISAEDPLAVIVFEVPLLFEAGYGKYFDRTAVVYCRRETAVKRLAEKGVARDEAIRRIRSQMPVAAKKKKADFVIDNDNGIERTEAQVRDVFRLLQNLNRGSLFRQP